MKVGEVQKAYGNDLTLNFACSMKKKMIKNIQVWTFSLETGLYSSSASGY